MLFRSPEAALPSLAALLAACRADLSADAPKLLEDLLPQIKHAKETVRWAPAGQRSITGSVKLLLGAVPALSQCAQGKHRMAAHTL